VDRGSDARWLFGIQDCLQSLELQTELWQSANQGGRDWYLLRMSRGRLIILCLAPLAFVACGGASSGTGSPPTEASLQSAVRESTEAVLSSKPKVAYGYLSDDCKEKMSLSEFSGLLMFGVAFLTGMADVELKDIEVGSIEVSELTATSANVRSELRTKDGDVFTSLDDSEPIKWIYENDGWRSTDCEDFESDSSTGFELESPDCSDLVDGEEVPASFRDEDTGEIDLTCMDGDTLQLAFTMPCWFGERTYSTFDNGYAFQDEGVYRSGEVRGCLPACDLLESGYRVPSAFSDDSTAGFNLNCEADLGEDDYSFEWECFDSERTYVTSDRGYAFTDDRVFMLGDSPIC